MFFKLYAEKVLKYYKQSFLLGLIFIGVFAILGKDVRLNNNYAELFAINNDANQYREFYRNIFGADDSIFIAIVEPESADGVFFQELEKITNELELQPDYIRALSVINSSVIRNVDDDIYIDPVFDQAGDTVHDDLTLEKKMALLRESPITANRFISKTVDSFILMAELPAEFDRYKKVKEPAENFQRIVESGFVATNVEIQYAGIAYTRIGILKLMMRDLFMLVPLTSLVIAIFTFLLFRSYSLIAISFFATTFAAIGTIGMMGFYGDDINQLTMTFPVLLMVIVVANSIHFFHRYFRELELGKTVEEAVFITAEKVSKAAFLSCLTTAIGFYALLTADMKILKSFGFYLGSGVLVSFVGLILIVPPALLWFKPKSNGVYQFSHFGFIDRATAKIIRGKTRWLIILTGVALLFISVKVGQTATYDYVLKDMLDTDHPQVLAGDTLDKDFSGALPLEFSLLGQADDFKKAENLRKVDQLHDWLTLKGVDESALSLARVLKSLNKAFVGENIMPDTDAAVAQLLLLAEGSSDRVVEQLVTDDFSHARIRAFIPDIGAQKMVGLKAEFNQYSRELFAGTGIKAEMTGELPVAYEGMNRLTYELLKSVLMALLFIVITILLVFRDWGLALGSIFPNVLPILLGVGFYALTGQGLNPLPGIAFCIAIGIAVDDTVHLFARFNEELQSGSSREQSILLAVKEVKGALLSSSLILTVGFLIFLYSGFVWNRQLGVLGAFLIITALLADLLFTPAVLSLKKGKANG